MRGVVLVSRCAVVAVVAVGALAVGALAACGETLGAPDATMVDATPDAFVCEANTMPATPAVEGPTAGRIDVIPDELVITSSAFADPDVGPLGAEAHGGSEFEIWNMAGPTPFERVWRAEIDGAVEPALLTQVTLADGAFEGIAAGRGLDDWEPYVVRVRHRDDRGACSRWSAWSSDLQFRTDDGSSWLFDPDHVHDVFLEIPPVSWDSLNAEAYPPGCVPYARNYYSARLVFDGVIYDGVGLRIKGGCGSSRDLNGKAGFKVNLDWDDPAIPGCPASRRLLGQKHLTLNNGIQDASATHERLGYALYQLAGVPTPRASSVRVHVNGQYWGVYQHIESIDRRFLQRWFASKEGMLYEGTYWCDLLPSNVTGDSGCLTREFKPDACDMPEPGADPQDYTLLEGFVQQIDDMPIAQFYPQIEAFFDFDTFLSQWAAEAILSHWDAYEFSIMNNYRVYHDPSTDRWTMIPTGIDQTWSGDQEPWDVYGVLARRCLEEPDCELAFATRLASVNDLFEASTLPAFALSIYNQIYPDVAADPRREYDMGTFEWAQQDLQDYLAWRPGRIREILSAHGF